MATTNSERSFEDRSRPEIPAGNGALALLVAAALVPAGVVLWHVPAQVALPTVSILSILMAVIIGLVAWFRNEARSAAKITNWDIAAAFMLVGCVAGLLGDPQQALELVGGLSADR